MISDDKSVAVEFQDVSFELRQGRLVSDLNLTLYQGECLVLLGRSGSGKTTTMKLVNHLLMPSKGQVLVLGKPTTNWDPIQLRRTIGYVIQDVGLFPHFTIADNVGLVPTLQGWETERKAARVRELLELVGLDYHQFAHRYPRQLSGGQRQRVGVARALAADPPLMLMDEPFGALDPITRLDIQQEFHQLQVELGKTVIFVTHDIQEAFLLASKIGLMCNGRLVFLGTPQEFLASEDPEAQRYMGCLQPVTGLLHPA